MSAADPGTAAPDAAVPGAPAPAADGAAPAVVVTPRSFGRGRAAVEEELHRAGLQVLRGPADHDMAALAPLLARARAWIAGTGPVTDAHLRAAPHLRVVARYGVGVDNVDRAAAARRGVVVTNTPAANAEAVADLAAALLLAVLRQVPAGDRDVRAGAFPARRGRELGTLTLGVVGFGRIGRALAQRVRGFGCTVLACDPAVPDAEVRAHGAEPADAAGVAANADAVSLHTPGGAAVADARWLAGLRPGAVLVNTARADVVDEHAVAAALRSGLLCGYAADMLGTHGDRGTDAHAAATAGGRGPAPDTGASPLLAADLADRVVLTPHLGAQTVEAVDRMGTGAVGNVLAVLAGRAPADPVPYEPGG